MIIERLQETAEELLIAADKLSLPESKLNAVKALIEFRKQGALINITQINFLQDVIDEYSQVQPITTDNSLTNVSRGAYVKAGNRPTG